MNKVERRSEYKWSTVKFITSMMRPERWVMLYTLFSLYRDNFKREFDDKAWIVMIAHICVLVLCCFAEVIRKRIEFSTFQISKGDTNVKIGELPSGQSDPLDR
ncbi:MAG: hypothetical protein Ta2B_10500 [Termitinemataceae bacterium]|nr:MAG: hypothetical protein Ta2B_10500 [Termitinemataceae bacterium]